MSKEFNFRQLKNFIPLLAGIATALAVVAAYPEWRSAVRQKIFGPYRKVLSVASGELKEGQKIKVVKIRTHEGLFLEVYSVGSEDERPLVDRIELPDRRDGFFHFRGRATNLALDDVNGDDIVEILAPTFDDDLVAHLNVYAFDADSKRFSKLTADTSGEK